MNKYFEFENRYKAVLTDNEQAEKNSVQLYSPDGYFLASSLCESEVDFQPTANGLLQGYFAGWSACKRLMQKSISEACRIDMIK